MLLGLVLVPALLLIVAVRSQHIGCYESKESCLASNVYTIRQAIDLYRQQRQTHPDATTWSELLRQLFTATEADDSARWRFGSYMRQGRFPDNPITRRTDGWIVQKMPSHPIGPEAWIYCRTTGEIRANVKGIGPSGTPYFDL